MKTYIGDSLIVVAFFLILILALVTALVVWNVKTNRDVGIFPVIDSIKIEMEKNGVIRILLKFKTILLYANKKAHKHRDKQPLLEENVRSPDDQNKKSCETPVVADESQ